MSAKKLNLIGKRRGVTVAPVIAASDPNFEKVSLLLKMDGANNSTVFTDSSGSPKTVTRIGDSKISTTESKTGGSSAFLDGTGDFLTIPVQKPLDLLSGDFTLEFWMRPSVVTGNRAVMAQWSQVSGKNGWIIFTIGNKIQFYFVTDTSALLTQSDTIAANQWYHVAITRSGNSFKLFVNGVSKSTATSTTTKTMMTDVNMSFASYYGNTGNLPANLGGFLTWQGYIDEVRLTKGLARYINNFDVPVNGYPTEGIDENFDQVGLLLKMDGADNSTVFIDSADNPVEITAVGDAKLSTTQIKYGTASAFFDGTGDYLTAPYNEKYNLATGDWTVEFWMYPTALRADETVSINVAANSYGQVRISRLANGALYLLCSTNGSSWISTATTAVNAYVINQWQHVAATRTGSTFRLFVNGVQVLTYTSASDLINTSQPVVIGAAAASITTGRHLGYMDGVRITKGLSRYTATFYPPYAEFSLGAISPIVQGAVTMNSVATTQAAANFVITSTDAYYSNVVLLMHGNGSNNSNNFADHSLYNRRLTTVGDTVHQTAIKKYGLSSIKFDGTGDSISAAQNNDFNYGTGDFAIEFWLYTPIAWNSQAANAGILSYKFNAADGGWVIYRDATAGTNNLSIKTTSGTYTTTGTPTQDTWEHWAISRQGTTLRWWKNGALDSTFTLNASDDFTSTNAGTVFYAGFNQTSSAYLNGYLDDIRITKGVARYTAAFTAPTAELPHQTDTNDTYWSNVSLLLTADGGQINDRSSYSQTIVNNGGITTVSAETKNYTHSINFDGASKSLTFPHSIGYNFGDQEPTIGEGDFTIEFWAKTATAQTSFSVFFAGPFITNTEGILQLGSTSNGNNKWAFSSTVVGPMQSTSNANTNTWTHVAIVRDGLTLRLFINGVQEQSTTASSTVPLYLTTSTGQTWLLGRWTNGGTDNIYKGYVDSIRITKGFARYTSTFGPPSVKFPTQ